MPKVSQMFNLLYSLAILLAGYVGLAHGPALFAAKVMDAVCGRAAARAAAIHDSLHAYGVPNNDRFHDGNGWKRDEGEQRLLARALDAALRRTEIANQYPNSMVRAMAA